MDVDKSPGFTITSENPDFLSKMRGVFSGIDGSSSNMLSSDSAIESDEDTNTKEVCATRPKQRKTTSEKPVDIQPPPKPDYVLNPSQYTKYSLEDTELSDNRANAQAAFQFLQELEDRKKADASAVAEDEPADGKQHMFRAPKRAGGATPSEDEGMTDNKKNTGQAACDKVELEHLEENISAKEFANEIAAKLDDSISKIHPNNDSSSTAKSNKEKFKPVLKKHRMNLRSKVQEE